MGDRNYHEFTENINDASMCVCGVPDLGHDAVYSRRDEHLDCGCVPPGSLNEPGRHFCGKYNPPLPDPEPGMGASIADFNNDCGFMGTYAEHRAMGCCPGPNLNPLEVLQRAASTAAWQRVLAKHQLATVLPGGVLCTCGAELAALNPPLDDEAVKGEPLALAVHQLQELEAADE